jgi:hypothetical protein
MSLHIEQGVRVEFYPIAVSLDPSAQPQLVHPLDSLPLLLEVRAVLVVRQPLDEGKLLEPVVGAWRTIDIYRAENTLLMAL